jgi:adenylyl-sulfate kinase
MDHPTPEQPDHVADSLTLGGGAGTAPSHRSSGFTIWLTGLSGSGKSTVTAILERELRSQGHKVEVLDGDVVRTHLTKGLGFTRADRDENIRRVGWVCELLSRNDVIAIAAVISPYRSVRDEVRQRIGRFVEVYMEAPVDVLAERDVKGLYRRAMAGELANFTGVSDPYEPPIAPEVICHSDGRETPEQSARKVLERLAELGYTRGASGGNGERAGG